MCTNMVKELSSNFAETLNSSYSQVYNLMLTILVHFSKFSQVSFAKAQNKAVVLQENILKLNARVK
jgi:hypothetical protein